MLPAICPGQRHRKVPSVAEPDALRAMSPQRAAWARCATTAGSAVKLARMLSVGDQVPDVQVWMDPREQVNLRELAREKPLLLVYYLFDWSST